jgi:hypothetical protein
MLKKKKGKAVPLQASSGPEGSRKLRFPDFMTTAQNGGKVVSLNLQTPYRTLCLAGDRDDSTVRYHNLGRLSRCCVVNCRVP